MKNLILTGEIMKNLEILKSGIITIYLNHISKIGREYLSLIPRLTNLHKIIFQSQEIFFYSFQTHLGCFP